MRRYLPTFISVIIAIAVNTILGMFFEVPFWARLLVAAAIVLSVTLTVSTASKRLAARRLDTASNATPPTASTTASDA